MSDEPKRLRRPVAGVVTSDASWPVAETPSEVEELVEKAISGGRRFVTLTSAVICDENDHYWNGREVRLKIDDIQSIVPPWSSTVKAYGEAMAE